MAKKKKTKFEQAAHIKKHTEGTSNELSFSVLDAAKKAAEEGQVQKSKGLFGHFPLFTFPSKKTVKNNPSQSGGLSSSELSGNGRSDSGLSSSGRSGSGLSLASDAYVKQGLNASQSKKISGSASFSSADEITRRKKTRRRQRRLVFALIVTLSLALIGVAGYFTYSEYTNHVDHVSSLTESLNKISQADETIVSMDDAINTAINQTTFEAIEAVLDQVEGAQFSLDEAEQLALQARDGMRDSSDKEAANQALVTIDARREMLDRGSSLLKEDKKAKEMVDALNKAWDLVLQADVLAREAADLVTDTTEENVTASQTTTKRALELFNQAKESYDAISIDYPEASFEKQKLYLDKRTESLNYALASNDAILVHDKTTAEEQNAAYNQSDAEAADIAEEFPENPVQPVLNAYDLITKESREKYSQARTKAGTADAFLRDYLGTSNK